MVQDAFVRRYGMTKQQILQKWLMSSKEEAKQFSKELGLPSEEMDSEVPNQFRRYLN